MYHNPRKVVGASRHAKYLTAAPRRALLFAILIPENWQAVHMYTRLLVSLLVYQEARGTLGRGRKLANVSPRYGNF